MFPGETILSGGKKEPGTSDFRVLKSAAGHYIGTIFTHDGKTCGCKPVLSPAGEPSDCTGLQEPGTRETGYFDSKEEAEKALEQYKKTGKMPKERY